MKQEEDDKTLDMWDIFLFTDSEWCYRFELLDTSYADSPYSVVVFGTKEWEKFINERNSNA